jgi:hypothetical protein
VSRGGHGNQIDLYRGVEHTESSQKSTSLAVERAEGGRRKDGDMAATWALSSVCARGEEREDRRESGRVQVLTPRAIPDRPGRLGQVRLDQLGSAQLAFLA